MTKWTHSVNGDYHSVTFDSREEAIEEGREECRLQGIVGGVFYIDEVELVTPKISPYRIIEDMQEQANYDYNATGDYLEEVSHEDAKDLGDRVNKAIQEWAEEVGQSIAVYVSRYTEEVPVLSPGDTSKTYLKPCPFCSSNVTLEEYSSLHEGIEGLKETQMHRIRCRGNVNDRLCPLYHLDFTLNSKEELIKLWNTRTL